MRTPHEPLYHQIWLKIKAMAKAAVESTPTTAKPEVKLRSHEKFIAQVALLDLEKTERKNGQSFKSWLIETYHHKPEELIDHLFFLQWIRHGFHHAIPWETHIIEHICSKPKAIEILNLVFSRLHPYNFQIILQTPPYALKTNDDVLFKFLIDNHEKYCRPNSPIFWAIIAHEQVLLNKILAYNPSWLNLQNHEGNTPLMVAIQQQNKDALEKLISLKPNHLSLNKKNENIAHIACQSGSQEWLISLIKDPKYASLEISQMIVDYNIRDINQQIPLCHAVYQGYISLVKNTIIFFPLLKASLFQCYFRAIETNSIHYFNILFDELDLDFSVFGELQVSLILHAMKQPHEEAFQWLLERPFLHPELRKSLLFFKKIEKNDFSVLNRHLQSLSIDWQAVPAEISFKISCYLLKKNQSQIIAELGLFDFHSNFHTYYCPKTHDKKTFFHYFFNEENLKLSPIFLNYFLGYLEKNQRRYPNWLAQFHEDFLKIFALFPIDANYVLYGEPLLHFIESFFFINQPSKRLNYLNQFITPETNLNVKDSKGEHLFTKLICKSEQGLERIISLKNTFSDFSLENLDNRGSNLLLLSIENNHLTALRWCLNQNIDPFNTRTSDNLSAVHLILQGGNIEMFDILRKHIKKNRFLSFIQEIVLQKKDDWIALLFSHEKPFGWVMTDYHIEQLKTIIHPVIQARFNPPPEVVKKNPSVIKELKVAVENVPSPKPLAKLMVLNFSFILELIHSQNVKRFNLLIEDVYQESLESIFSEHFDSILFHVFRSPCKNINKIFIRIPTVQKQLTSANIWQKLFTQALVSGDTIVYENMLGRQSIFESLKLEKLIHYRTAIENHPLIWRELFLQHFPLTKEEQVELFEIATYSENPKVFLMFMHHQSYRHLFTHAPENFWYHFLMHGLEFLMSIIEIHSEVGQVFLKHSPNLYLKALREDHEKHQKILLDFPIVRQKLKECGQEYFHEILKAGDINKILSTWAKYHELQSFTRPYYPIHQVVLPPILHTAFQIGFSANSTLYIVGSTIQHLLEGISLEILNDIDFISNKPPSESSIFRQSKVQSQLYFCSLFLPSSRAMKLEYFVTEHPKESFIASDFSQRDFTVNSLYCDAQGNIFDPTNMGLADLQTRTIRSIQNAQDSFNRDPIRILRAIRLMTKGFNLSPEVSSAISTWQPQEQFMNYGHIYAMANMMLTASNAYLVFDILVQFKLIRSLLNFADQANFQTLQAFVCSEAHRYKCAYLSPLRN